MLSHCLPADLHFRLSRSFFFFFFSVCLFAMIAFAMRHIRSALGEVPRKMARGSGACAVALRAQARRVLLPRAAVQECSATNVQRLFMHKVGHRYRRIRSVEGQVIFECQRSSSAQHARRPARFATAPRRARRRRGSTAAYA